MIFIKNSVEILLVVAASCGLRTNLIAAENTMRLMTGTNEAGQRLEWNLSASRAKALPKWDADHEERILLPVGVAVHIGMAAATNRISLENVTIKCITPNRIPEFKNVFYYVLTFSTKKGGMRKILILMDGTELKPTVE